jgi:dTDP-4-amino-4,6-dideoxygalactose transaminase
MSTIPFNRPPLEGRELTYVSEVLKSPHWAGDGSFTKLCNAWLEEHTQAAKALLTHSCTAALEMAALLCELEPGDEVIMPSFTFVSTANAVVLRRATPVFVDIRSDTFNIDETKIEAAITAKTKAILVVHYAGVGCEMDRILEISRAHQLIVIEDAAQGLMASYKGRALGTIGSLGCLSFHETKNIVSGEGGALLINDRERIERAEIIREKGTDRSRFFRGQIDKYTWVDVGSSYLPSELIAAVLLAQLESAESLTRRRLALWTTYKKGLQELEAKGLIRLPVIPADCQFNGHIFYIVTRSLQERTKLQERLKMSGIQSVFHYIPLHSSPAGLKWGRASGDLSLTSDLSDRLLRLPLWVDMHESDIARVIESVGAFYQGL